MEKNFYKAMGRRIADLRAKANITQEVLAEHAEVGTSYVARIEGGSRKPTIDVLTRIASALKVPVWRLLVDDRLTPEEKQRKGASRQLDAAIRGLEVADVELLAQVAKRLGAGRRSR